MARPNRITSRTQLANYCLRKLGAPVIQINVAPEQIDDRIDEALDRFIEFHYDSTARIFHKHQITKEDLSNQYISIPDTIVFINKVLPFTQGSGGYFNPVYEMRLSDFLSFGSMTSSLQYYTQWQQNVQMTQMLTEGVHQQIDFALYENTLKLRVEWGIDINVGDWIIIDSERILSGSDESSSPPELADFWGNLWLKDYTTALIKEQWGQNLSKFEGIQMPGGVTFNGERISSEAKEEIMLLEEQIRDIWEKPLGEVYVG